MMVLVHEHANRGSVHMYMYSVLCSFTILTFKLVVKSSWLSVSSDECGLHTKNTN